MFILMQNQLLKLSERQRDAFESRLVTYLRMEFPASVTSTSDEALLETVRSGCRTGARFGIVLQNDLRRLLEFLITYERAIRSGNDIQEHMMAILNREDVDGTRKMDALDLFDLRLAGGVG